MTHETNEFGMDICPNCRHTLLCTMLTSFPPRQQYSCDHCGYLEIDGKVINEGTNTTINRLNDDGTIYTINHSDKCLHPNITFAYADADGLHYSCYHCGEGIVTTWYELLKPTVDKIIEEHKNEQ